MIKFVAGIIAFAGALAAVVGFPALEPRAPTAPQPHAGFALGTAAAAVSAPASSSERPLEPYPAVMDDLDAGRTARASAALDELIEKNPEIAPYLQLASVEIMLRRGDTAAAHATLRSIAALEDRNVALRALDRAASLKESERDFAGAAAASAELAARVGGDRAYEYQLKQARLLALAGRNAEAEALNRRILMSRIHPQYRMLAASELIRARKATGIAAEELADIFYNGGDFNSAADQYEIALSKATGNRAAELTFQLARSHERSDHFKTAIKFYDQMRKKHPGHKSLEVLYYTGLCYQRIGEDEKGEEYFKKLLGVSPKSSYAPYALYRMATRRDRKDRRADAFHYYNRILREFPRSRWADEAAWRIGFALLEDGQLQGASTAFADAVKRFPRSDYASAMGYWRARILEDIGDPAAANRYQEVIRASNDLYYVGRSVDRLRGLGVQAPQDWRARVDSLSGKGKILDALSELKVLYYLVDRDERAEVAARMGELLRRTPQWAQLYDVELGAVGLAEVLGDGELAREISRLVEIGAYRLAADELVGLKAPGQVTPERRVLVAQILARGGRYREAIREVERVLREEGDYCHPAALPLALAEILYPRFYSEIVEEKSRDQDIDPLFALAVIREESRFDAGIASWAGAQGLMQIMPATGRDVARRMGIENFTVRDLLTPEVNIAIGTWYLGHLGDLYDGRKYLTLAGYNAGPGNANRWLRQNASASEEVWIEKISFNETRQYVKRVLGTYWLYRDLTGGEISRNLSIAKAEAPREAESR